MAEEGDTLKAAGQDGTGPRGEGKGPRGHGANQNDHQNETHECEARRAPRSGLVPGARDEFEPSRSLAMYAPLPGLGGIRLLVSFWVCVVSFPACSLGVCTVCVLVEWRFVPRGIRKNQICNLQLGDFGELCLPASCLMKGNDQLGIRRPGQPVGSSIQDASASDQVV